MLLSQRFIYIVLILLPLSFSQAQSSNLSVPKISANALFLYQSSNFKKEDASTNRNGFDLQEAELAFYSDVDPYSKLSLLLSVHPEYELNATTNKIEQKWLIEPEELFAELFEIPGINIKFGKFKASFGKQNSLHKHAFPFVDAPLVNDQLLGKEGLTDVGASGAALLPLDWYSEFTLQALRGEGENSEFNSPSAGDFVGLAHWKNLSEMSESLTAELGLSYASGSNSLKASTHLSGADFTMKWRPVEGGKYQSWILSVEYIRRDLGQTGTVNEKSDGYFTWGQYQFAERWAVAYRNEFLKIENSDRAINPNALINDSYKKNTLGILFSPSEFSFYRMEYGQSLGPAQANGESEEKLLYFQANFTIGAHPAHSY